MLETRILFFFLRSVRNKRWYFQLLKNAILLCDAYFNDSGKAMSDNKKIINIIIHHARNVSGGYVQDRFSLHSIFHQYAFQSLDIRYVCIFTKLSANQQRDGRYISRTVRISVNNYPIK